MKLKLFLLIAIIIIVNSYLSAAPGDLDPTFLGAGKVQMSAKVRQFLPTNLLLAQPDGKILAGFTASPGGDLFQTNIMRLNPDGTPDLSFGAGGTGIIGGPPAGFSYEQAYGMARQPSGKIVVTGRIRSTASHRYFCSTARLNADGSFDNTFGTGGWQIIDIAASGGCDGYSVAVGNDGKIVISGYGGKTNSQGQVTNVWMVARFNEDGSTDTSFAQNGVFTYVIGHIGGVINVLVQPDGKIILAGDVNVGNAFNFVLLRLNTDGSHDQTFGSNGISVVSNSFVGFFYHAALQPDGKIVMLGSPMTNFFALARVNDDGSIDSTFGSDGFTLVPPAYPARDPRNLVLQPDGKILAGGAYTYANGITDFGVMRFNTDGTIDSAPAMTFFGRPESVLNSYWGTNGTALAGFTGANERLSGMAVDPAGRAIVSGWPTGTVHSYFTMARFQGDNSPYASIWGTVRTAGGMPIKNAPVMISGGGLETPLIVRTSNFGIYQFTGLPVTETYKLSISMKRYQFVTPEQTLMLNADVSNLDFTANQ